MAVASASSPASSSVQSRMLLLVRVRRPNPGQPDGDCRRQADDGRGGRGYRRLAVRQRNGGGGDVLAVPPDRAGVAPVYASGTRLGP